MSNVPADRLRALREKKYETAKEAADAFGWNEVTYRSHENGTRNIPLHTARKYALAYGTTASYLLGLGSVSSGEQAVNHVINVPLVGTVNAGSFSLGRDSTSGNTYVPAIPRPDIPAGVQYAVEVDGPSVNLRIPDGAFAVCAPYDKFPGGPKHGQLVHVVRERAGMYEHTIKELHYTRDGMVLMPCSSDPRYQDQVRIEHPDDDTLVRIHGVVIGLFQAL